MNGLLALPVKKADAKGMRRGSKWGWIPALIREYADFASRSMGRQGSTVVYDSDCSRG
jgi:hypothetical protein